MAHTKKRRKYLENSADILCKATYTLCKEQLKERSESKCPDAKVIKDICATVKDVISISNGLSDTEENDREKIVISLEGKTEDYAL